MTEVATHKVQMLQHRCPVPELSSGNASSCLTAFSWCKPLCRADREWLCNYLAAVAALLRTRESIEAGGQGEGELGASAAASGCNLSLRSRDDRDERKNEPEFYAVIFVTNYLQGQLEPRDVSGWVFTAASSLDAHCPTS